MNKVKVRKDELLKELEHNRSEHRSRFERAVAGYSDKVREELEKYLERVKHGDVLEVRVSLPKPEDHSEDYDRAIKMVQMSVDENLELTEQEFAELVMDDWGWKRQFMTSTAYYVQEA